MACEMERIKPFVFIAEGFFFKVKYFLYVLCIIMFSVYEYDIM